MKSVVRFVSEVRLELSRVIWPKMDEWYGSTAVVLFLIAIFAIYLKGIDFGWSTLMEQIFQTYS